ncbi:hypothetical protein SprV_0802608000 [Sparganum proliferum]
MKSYYSGAHVPECKLLYPETDTIGVNEFSKSGHWFRPTMPCTRKLAPSRQHLMSLKPTDGGECPPRDAHEPIKCPPLHFSNDPENKLCTVEAEAAVTETAFAVRDIRISEALPFNQSLAYLNLTTLEGESLCVQINANGFQPVGIRYDEVSGRVPPPESGGNTSVNHTGIADNDNDDEDEDEEEEEEESPEVYETIYALLSARSPGFRDRFSQRLTERLTELQAQVDATSGADV